MIANKIKWIVGILLVFALVLATNLLDRDNFRQITNSVITIYEDRLVAKDLVFEFSLLVQEKEIAWLSADSSFFAKRNQEVNQKINDLSAQYLETVLTDKEARVLDELQVNLQALIAFENARLAGVRSTPNQLEEKISKVKENLYDLSKIQLEEGRRQVSLSERAMATVELFTRLEIYFLIILAVLVQIIVIYKPK